MFNNFVSLIFLDGRLNTSLSVSILSVFSSSQFELIPSAVILILSHFWECNFNQTNVTVISLASHPFCLCWCNNYIRIIDLNLKTVVDVTAYIMSAIPNQLLDRELLQFQVFDSDYLDSLITCLDDVVVGSLDPLDWVNSNTINNLTYLLVFLLVPDYQLFIYRNEVERVS